jgi:hypothetical protein
MLREEDKALIVAMELLRRAIGDNTVSIAANTRRTEDDFATQAQATSAFVSGANGDSERFRFGGSEDFRPSQPSALRDSVSAEPPGGEPGASALLSVFGVVEKLSAIAGPAAIVAQVLQSNLNSLQLLDAGVQSVVGVLAPVLVPATALAASGFVAASEILDTELVPALDTFSALFTSGIPVLEAFIGRLAASTKAAQLFAESASVSSTGPAGLGDEFANPTPEVDPLSNLVSGASGGGEDATNLSRSALSDVMQSLRTNVGSRASITGLDQAGKNAPLTALNQDSLEARLLQMQLDTLNRIERALSRQSSSRVYDPDCEKTGVGNYERGSSSVSGGDYGEGG